MGRIFDLEQPSEPIIKFEGHTGGIKQVMYSPDNKQLLSCSDDKTVRVWDTANGAEIKSFTTSEPIGGLELSEEGDIITLAAGHKVIFLDANRFEKIKEVNIPSPTYTASLHQDRDIFVCGGEDLKLYKFDFQTGLEIENFKGHFGPVHCVRFSPDGELYASGSEDGTLRLWQTNVGKTYACGSVLTVSAERPCPPPRLKLSVRWWAGSQRSSERGRQFCLNSQGFLISASDTVSSIDRQTLLHLPKLVGSWLRLSQTKQAKIVTLSAWKILTLVFDCPPGYF